MMFLTRLVVTILTSCMMTRQAGAGNVSENILDFITMFSGLWDNSEQINKGFTHRVLLQGKVVPVDLPQLSSEPMIFLEEAANGITRILQLCVITEGTNNVLYVTPYNFTDLSLYKRFGDFNLSDLAKLKRENLHSDPECKVAVERYGKDVFIGNWPDCKDMVDGLHPTYTATYKCDVMVVVVPAGAGETPARVPYKSKRTGPRFPLVNAPPNYVSPCEKTAYKE